MFPNRYQTKDLPSLLAVTRENSRAADAIVKNMRAMVQIVGDLTITGT